MNLQIEIIGVQIFVLKIWKNLRILGWNCCLERLESFWSNNPGRDGGCKVLGQEWSERNVLPLLDISGAPVVQKAEPKDMISSITNFDGATLLVSLTNNGSHFQLEIHESAIIEAWCFAVRRGLTSWSSDWGSIENNGGCSTMIANWDMQPVWLKSIVDTSEHHTDVMGVVLGRVEIGVVSDEDWHSHLLLVNWEYCLSQQVVSKECLIT